MAPAAKHDLHIVRATERVTARWHILGAMLISPDEILTPSQLGTLARSLLEDAFPLVFVEGELSNLARPASGHLYFTLKDARAQVRCAMFRPKSQWLRFQPRDGVKVLARARVTLYEARGDFQLVVESLEEAGEGALRRAFEQLKARLQAEGLFDAERKRPLPAWPRRIGVLTSPNGAAVRDVLSVLARRFPLLEVDVLPVQVQGESAPRHILDMLQRATTSGRYDLLLLARGGGSLEDLWAFNDEALTRAVAASPVPIISAIGHETDFSLTDFAADLRAPTPSAAAELLAPERGELLQRLGTLRRRLGTLDQYCRQQRSQALDRLYLRLQSLRPAARLALLSQRQQQLTRRLRAAIRERLHHDHARLRHTGALLTAARPQHRLAALRERLRITHPRVQTAIVARLQRHTQHLRELARSLEAVSPLATVARGYAIIQHMDGTAIRSVHQVQPGARVLAQLTDGRLPLLVEQCQK